MLWPPALEWTLQEWALRFGGQCVHGLETTWEELVNSFNVEFVVLKPPVNHKTTTEKS